MSRFLLDTDTCVFFLRKRHDIAEKSRSVGVWNCDISQVTIAELRYGAECSDFVGLCHDEINLFCEYVSVVPICNGVIGKFAFQKAALRKTGQLIPDFDIMIGATAIYHELTLVTNNTRHFERLKPLKIENWII